MGEWISWVEAQQILGVRHESIARFRRQGLLRSRREHPSLNRAEVEALAVRRAGERAPSKPPGEPRRRATDPPDDGHEWLTTSQAGALMGVSRARVWQLTQAGLVPVTVQARRRWYRRDLLEVTINAREMRNWMRSHGAPVRATDRSQTD